MSMTSPLEQIGNFLSGLLEKSEDIFLVEIKITPGNQIIVLLDADKGITIEKCTAVNKALYKYIEESGFYPEGNFSLEVSSPGVDKPLKLHRQYQNNIGRSLEVELKDGTRLEGTLTVVSEEEVTLEEKEGKGKKATTKTTIILFNQIKRATVLITF